MTKADYEDFVVYLAGVMSLYKQEATEFTARMWWRVCAKYSLEAFMGAMDRHVADGEQGRFAPMPADVVRQLEGTKTNAAMLAWGKVYSAMVSVGAYEDVCFDDGLIHLVVADLGGWPRLCRTDLRELGFLQNQFCKSYQAYAANGGGVFAKRLCGLRDGDEVYERYGLEKPAVVMVGDVKKCEVVMALGGDQEAMARRVVKDGVKRVVSCVEEKALKAV